jgi:hypothetical protein
VTEAELADHRPEQDDIKPEVRDLVAAAVVDLCAGCSTAKFAPIRFGRAAAAERLPEGAAEHFAARLRACPGLGKIGTAPLCRLPSGT